MKFKDNADITTLLLGGKINIWIDTDKGSKYLDLILIPPTIETLYCDFNFQAALGILNLSEEKLQTTFPIFKGVTQYNLLKCLKFVGRNDLMRYYDCLLYTFQKVGINLQLEENLLIDGMPINEEIYTYLYKIILYISKIRDKENNIWNKDEQYKKAQDMINKIKNQNKPAQTGGAKDFEKNFISIVYQYGLSPLEVKKLNAFQFEKLLNYYNGAVSQDIMTVAAGNGLTKKIKTISQGGKK